MDMWEQNRSISAWIVLKPSADLPGQWVAHCLDYDLVSQGNSLHHATDMIIEALILVFEDELQQGRELQERRAPARYWDEMFNVLRQAHASTGVPAEEAAQAVAVAHLQLDLTVLQAGEGEGPTASLRGSSARSWTPAELTC